MSTNLRLSADAADALRVQAERTGRSQQDLMREAVDRYLGLGPSETVRHRAVAAGLVQPPTEFVDVEPAIRLRRGQNSSDLLDRDDR